MNFRSFGFLLSLIVAFTLARVVTTHRVFSQTSDEPHHLAAGYDVLKRHSFTRDVEHPPLARVFFAVPFVNTPDPPFEDIIPRGNALLTRNDRYTQNLARARAGNLPFLALGIIAVALWARHLFSPAAGLIAALLYASLPPILAHGGLATTDMAGAALFTVAVYVFTLFLEDPSWKRTLALAIVVGAGTLAKYSFPIFFPAAALILVLARRKFPIARLLIAIVVAALIVYAGFFFDLKPLIAGYKALQHHNETGHRAFLFQELRWDGWWYYFPVALFFKTPIPFLLLALIGCGLLLARKKPEITLIALAILCIVLPSRINIGVRHVLPIYGPLAVAAAYAVVELWRSPAKAGATFVRYVAPASAGVLVAWTVIGSLLAHPDYLPWFNEVTPRPHYRVLNDRNLDWGQDVLRLVRLTRREYIPSMTVSLFSNADFDRIGLPPTTTLVKMQSVVGWFAISEMQVAIGYTYNPELSAWLRGLLGGKSYRRVGKTIRLYYFPGARASRPQPSGVSPDGQSVAERDARRLRPGRPRSFTAARRDAAPPAAARADSRRENR